MTKKAPGRSCKQCGAPSDNKALCSRCDPNRQTQPHRDKYAEAQPKG
jgi:hypothetical protein